MPVTSRRSASGPSSSTRGDQRLAQRAAARSQAASPARSAASASSAGSSARASARRAPGQAPRSAAAGVTAWINWPWRPSTVRTRGRASASSGAALPAAQRSIGRFGSHREQIRRVISGRPPAGCPKRERNSSAVQRGRPAPCGRRGEPCLGALASRQRSRAPDRLAAPCSRTSQQATPNRSAATASRRVAVKSSACGSPHNSPITPPSPAHRRPSSIAHKAALASRASTWMRLAPRAPSPAAWTRPPSRIAIRSCTHSTGFGAASWRRTKPVQPASRGEAGNSSDRVALRRLRDGHGRGRHVPTPLFSRAGNPAGDEMKTSFHTTRNALVPLLFLFARVCEHSHSGDSTSRPERCEWGGLAPDHRLRPDHAVEGLGVDQAEFEPGFLERLPDSCGHAWRWSRHCRSRSRAPAR